MSRAKKVKKDDKATRLKEFFEAVDQMREEKGIDVEYLYEKIAEGIEKAVRKEYIKEKADRNENNKEDFVTCEINPDEQTIRVYIHQEIVKNVENQYTQVSLDKAKESMKDAKIGDTLITDLDTMSLGRIAAQTAKHVIRQGIKEAERGQVIREFKQKSQDLVSAKVSRIDPVTGNLTLEIGNGTAILPKSEQIPNESFYEGESTKVYVVEVKETERGPRVMISRSNPGLVKRLFEQEVPEIYDGIVTIKAISRDAGSRTKMAVYSSDEDVDPIGACIGQKGLRVNNIVESINGEKIDIVKYSEDPAEFIAASLAPADVIGVEILDEQPEEGKKAKKSCQVTVPDGQLSLAIGNGGQNVRLAAQLTGWNIDIKPESGFYEG